MAKTKSKHPADDTVIEVLTLLALGEVEPADAAAALNLDLPGLEALLAENPELADQASEKAKALQSDPDRTLNTSQRGLAAIAATLARRVHEQPDAMTVGELTSAGSLLEKIAGTSEKRRLELKAAIEPDKGKDAQRLPLIIVDDRTDQLCIFMIQPDDPRWVDSSVPEYRSPNFDWLEHFYPLGEGNRRLSLETLVGPTLKCMDAEGRVFGGAP